LIRTEATKTAKETFRRAVISQSEQPSSKLPGNQNDPGLMTSCLEMQYCTVLLPFYAVVSRFAL